MGTGSLIQGEDQLSKTVLNHKFVLVDTGTAVEALSTPLDGQVASVTADGAILKDKRLYVWDGSQWIDQANPSHLHDSADQGGELKDIEVANLAKIWIMEHLNPSNNMFHKLTSGSATYADTLSGTDGYVTISTGTTTNNAGNLVKAGLRYDFASSLYLQIRCNFATVDTGLTTRVGYNMEYAHISSNATAKVGIEGCDTCNGVNLRVVSADGTTRSATNTTDPMNAAAVYKLVYTPGINLTYRKNSGTVVTKTSNIPSSGVPDRSNVFVAGILTTNTTSKDMRIWGLKGIGTISQDSGEWV